MKANDKMESSMVKGNFGSDLIVFMLASFKVGNFMVKAFKLSVMAESLMVIGFVVKSQEREKKF